jgi:uncharacterized protein (DUF58 family)
MNLTARGTALVAVIALVGILGEWSPALGGVAWWRMLGGLAVLGLGFEWLATRRAALAGRIAGHERLYLGRASRVRVELENSEPRVWTLQFAPALPAALAGSLETETVRLAAGERATRSLAVRPLRIGEHDWGPLPLRIRGPLGLAWWSRPIVDAVRLGIVPDTLGPRQIRVGMRSGGTTTRSAASGSGEFHHIRDYRHGDPRHMIDWKAVARTDKLFTRVFGEDQHLEVMLLLDIGRTSRTEIDGMSQLGHYVNLAARFAEYCVASDDQVGMLAFADEVVVAVRPGRGLAAVRQVRRALSGLTPRPVEADVLGAALRVRQMVHHRCLVIVLTDLYERSATSQLVQTARLLVPKHLPFAVGLVAEDTLALGSVTAAQWLDPYRSFAAREYRRTLDANASRLVRLGAYALTARPAELDSRVLNQYVSLRAQHRI